jgi:tetratricopeptide (TPR) repeat protein
MPRHPSSVPLSFIDRHTTVLGEANDVQSLGDVYLRQDKLDEAQASFERAIELHRQAHNVLGEANSLQSLANLYLRQDNLQEAELCLRSCSSPSPTNQGPSERSRGSEAT